jgi:hypothetical protein
VVKVNPYGEFEEIDIAGTGKFGIFWEPTCSKERCKKDPLDSAIFVRRILRRIDLKDQVLEPLLRESHKETAETLLLPALDHSCSALKTADLDLDEGMSKKKAGLRALIFYRRHSHLLNSQLELEEFDTYEHVCGHVPRILRNAGYIVLSE